MIEKKQACLPEMSGQANKGGRYEVDGEGKQKERAGVFNRAGMRGNHHHSDVLFLRQSAETHYDTGDRRIFGRSFGACFFYGELPCTGGNPKFDGHSGILYAKRG